MSKFLRNQKGMSLVELVIAAGLVTLVVALSATPLVEMKKLEKRVEFQSGLDLSHQLALQKARNSEFLKSTVGLTAGSEQEKCFTGRGTSCSAYNTAGSTGYPNGEDRSPSGGSSESPSVSSTPPPVETLHYTQPNGLATTSEIYVTANCSALACKQVNVEVSTKQTGGSTTNGWASRPLLAKFSVPASALAGRQEIDFSVCNGRVVTGVNYDTLKAECAPLTGSQTCNGVAGGGPINTFGQPGPLSAANCQPPVNQSCGTGMAKFGMISGQSGCAPAMTCSDPMSPACAAPPAATPCVAAWSPDPSTVCAGDAFTQTDLNACPTSIPQAAIGTNAAICAVSSCTLSGPVRWSDAALGPCGVNSASLTTSAGGTGVISNEQMGYAGTLTATCVDNSPAASTFDMAGAAKSCAPIKCTGLPALTEWSAVGVKSAVAGPGLDTVGPWPCGGVLNAVQSPVQPPGTLLVTAADPGARAVATNSYATATSGSVTFTCTDPGPASAARSGVLNYGSISCVTAPPTPTPGAGCVRPPKMFGGSGACWTYISPGPMEPVGKVMPIVLTGVGCEGSSGGGGSCSGTATCEADGTWTQWDDCAGSVYPPTPTPTPAPYCLYTCIENFMQTVDGRLELGETSPEICKQTPAMLTKFSMGCNGYGTSCGLTNPLGPMTQAVCGAASVPVPTPVPTPACQPDGYMTGVWGGSDDQLCVSVSSFAGIGTQPYALCCSGVHHANYGMADTVGGGNCNWTCGAGGAPPPPPATPAPTPAPGGPYFKYKYLGPGSCGSVVNFGSDLAGCDAAQAACGAQCMCTDADIYSGNCF